MKLQFLYIISGCLLFASCHLYSSYERSADLSDTNGLYRDTANAGTVLTVTDTTNFGNMPWQEVFPEPKLQALIAKALSQNSDIKIAEMNVEKMKAGLKISKLAYIPSLTFAPEGQISSFDFSKASKTYTLPIVANWNFGSWGSLRNTKKQAEANLEMTKASQQATQTAIIANVANMYYTLEMLDEQLKTTNATIVLWKETVETMEAMKEAAMVNEAAVAQAKANYYELLASVPELEKSIQEVENALCVILAEPPHNIDRDQFEPNILDQQLTAGVPMQLLSNRPDVKIAEYQLASNFYQLNIARSAFYPSLTLTGTAGWTNNAGMAVINPAKFIANAVGSIVQPLFANGQLMANLKISKLSVKEAELNFRQTLLKAGQEVSDALKSYQAATEMQNLRQQKVEALAKTTQDTKALFQYSEGTTYLETLTAQQSLLSGELSLINDKYTRVQAAIQLYQALGGGRI